MILKLDYFLCWADVLVSIGQQLLDCSVLSMKSLKKYWKYPQTLDTQCLLNCIVKRA